MIAFLIRRGEGIILQPFSYQFIRDLSCTQVALNPSILIGTRKWVSNFLRFGLLAASQAQLFHYIMLSLNLVAQWPLLSHSLPGFDITTVEASDSIGTCNFGIGSHRTSVVINSEMAALGRAAAWLELWAVHSEDVKKASSGERS